MNVITQNEIGMKKLIEISFDNIKMEIKLKSDLLH
jgi:hypothetical protein